MFSMRTLINALPSNAPQGVRGMATLKELRLRITSTKNIQKITKTMKMIASTRLFKVQKNMNVARQYGKSSTAFFEYAGTKQIDKPERKLAIAVTSDKGLCGGVHSSVSRKIKGDANQDPKLEIVCIGDKSKVQLSRVHPGKILNTFSGIGARTPHYHEVSLIANEILKLGPIDNINLVYNNFKTAISYETNYLPVYSLKSILASEKLDSYETEDTVLENFQEFSFVNSLYWAVMEGHASEISARRNAMDNATKNAGELISKLTIKFNRSRQASITTELIDIITGASAL